MGQKVHPVGLRLGITCFFRTHWYAKGRSYGAFIQEDSFIRKFLETLPVRYIISKVELERRGTGLRINIFTCQVKYFLIAENGKTVRQRLQKAIVLTRVTRRIKYGYSGSVGKFLKIFQKDAQIQVFIHQVASPNEDAACLACFIVISLEKRMRFRWVLRRVEECLEVRKRVHGFRLQVSGRLNGSEIARIEWIRRGQVSLHQLFSNLDFSYKVAHTTYGSIGVKVWLSVGV